MIVDDNIQYWPYDGNFSNIASLNVKFGDGTSTILKLTRVVQEISLHSSLPNISTVTTVLTFFNEHNKILEGELEFVLPTGAVVYGFGLDIDGVMVDGVVVEKEKARVTFEKEVRDHGSQVAIAEEVKGASNIFKTRIYPLPAQGERRVKLVYQTEGKITPEGNIVHPIPLNFSTEQLENIHIACTIKKSLDTDSTNANIPLLILPKSKSQEQFIDEEKRYFSEFKQRDVIFSQSDYCTIVLPIQKSSLFSASEIIEDTHESFFVVVDKGIPIRNEEQPGVNLPSTIAIYWDSSLSLEKANKKPFLDFLKKFFEYILTQNTQIVVLFYVFSDSISISRLFVLKKDAFDNILRFVNEIIYDGGTNIGALKFTKNQMIDNSNFNVDMAFLLTDGLSTYGANRPEIYEIPVHTITLGYGAINTILLKYIAETSGGHFFNLQDGNFESMIYTINQPPYQLLRCEYNPEEITEIFPRHSVSISTVTDEKGVSTNTIMVVGKLLCEETIIKLCYGDSGGVSHRSIVHLFQSSKSSKENLGICSRLWATKKIEALRLNPRANQSIISDLGTKYGIVTPSTSFIVLDTLQQHLKFKIPPAESRSFLLQQYRQSVQETSTKEENKKKKKLSQVENYSKKLCKWYSVDINAQRKRIEEEIRRKKQEEALSLQMAHQLQAELNGQDFNAMPPPQPMQQMEPMDSMDDRERSTGGLSCSNMLSARGTAAGEGLGRGGRGRGRAGAKGRYKAKGSMPVPCAASAPCSAPCPPPKTKCSKPKPTPTPTISKPFRMQDVRSDEDSIPVRRNMMSKGKKKFKAKAVRMEMEEEYDDDMDDMMDESKNLLESESEPGLTETEQVPPGEASSGVRGVINIQQWDPKQPYISQMKQVISQPGAAYTVYLSARSNTKYHKSPSFYFDCASFFFDQNDNKIGGRILSNVVELGFENPQLLRIVGYKLVELKLFNTANDIFQQILILRPEEPQSYRDLAIVKIKLGDLNEAIKLLHKVLIGEWDHRFEEIELTALIELNNVLFSPIYGGHYDKNNPVYPTSVNDLIISKYVVTLSKDLFSHTPVDLRVVCAWDTDQTDVDLHVIEPSGEECFFSHKNTKSGGRLSRDFQHGYGPEEYLLKFAETGSYVIKAKFFASHQQSLTGATSIIVTIYKFYGTINETSQLITVRLSSNKEILKIGEVSFTKEELQTNSIASLK